MKHFFTALFFIAIISASLFAQTIVPVPPDDATGGNLNRAIQTAIDAGTLSNTVFQLSAGSGYGQDYILTGIVTTPAHEKLTIIAPDPTPTSPPPQIVMQSGGGVTWTYNFDCFGDVTMKNLWISYTDVSGANTGAGLYVEDDSLANLSGKGEVAVFDNVVFDMQRTAVDGCVELRCKLFKGTFNNCYFRNDVDPHYRYYGRAVSWPYSSTTWHTDSISFVNCTFANLGYAYMQESPEYADHVWFNHCTFLNIAMFPLESSYWHWLSVTNSIFVNPYMYGDIPGQRGTGANFANGGSVNIDSLSTIGFTVPFTEADRHILFSNSSYFVEKWLTDYMDHGNLYSDTASAQNKPLPQPMMTIKTQAFFDTVANGVKLFPFMSRANLHDATDPGFLLPPTNQDSIKAFLLGRWLTGANVNWAYNPLDDINGVWPFNESLTYTNATLKTAGIGGFPIGDLYRWFPTQYTAWKAQETAENQTINSWLTSGITSAVKGTPGNLPHEYSMSQNYPNPFNPTTNIKYSVPVSGYVSLKVFNILGQEVATLFEGFQKNGSYNVDFDASRLTSGVYLYRIQSNGFTQTKKMILMK
jgi:hypothetical protein